MLCYIWNTKFAVVNSVICHRKIVIIIIVYLPTNQKAKIESYDYYLISLFVFPLLLVCKEVKFVFVLWSCCYYYYYHCCYLFFFFFCLNLFLLAWFIGVLEGSLKCSFTIERIMGVVKYSYL